MKRVYKYACSFLLILFAVFLSVYFIKNHSVAVLDPKGMIAEKERQLMINALLLMLIIVIPVLVAATFFSWRYRANNTKAKYTPNWDSHKIIETVWWTVPCIIISILGVITWKSCHELNPFKPIDKEKKSLKIQVVALEWKWLFIYPEQKIATVNFVQFPEHTPLNFEITADAPMNSFWIPQLGGQMYAMPGMRAKLHLIANQKGRFRGSSANLSGKGFSGMHFEAEATSEEDFLNWVESIKQSSNILTASEYTQLIEPTENHPKISFVLTEDGLFDQIIMKYMQPIP